MHKPDKLATAIFCVGSLFTVLWAHSVTDLATMLRGSAVGLGVTLLCTLSRELYLNHHALVRADLTSTITLYLLLFFEFLFPQDLLETLTSNHSSFLSAIDLSIGSFCLLLLGRHFVPSKVRRLSLLQGEANPKSVMAIFIIATCCAYFHMLLASDFNPRAMLSHFLDSRWNMPWARGQFGDASALLYEIGATIYLIPPLTGVVLARRRQFSLTFLVFAVCVFLVTIVYGFCTGTRNFIGVFLLTFVASFFLASRGSILLTAFFGVCSCGIFALVTVYGLQFRDEGLRSFFANDSPKQRSLGQASVYIDYNLWVVSRLIELFPKQYTFIGIEGPQWLIARPVPRALWPHKPTGDEVSPQTYLGNEGATVTASFVGETYMWGGVLSTLACAFSLGYLAAWWSAKSLNMESDIAIALYSSGLIVFAICMRSIYMLPVAALPPLAGYIVAYLTQRNKPHEQAS
jgi:hypothetical protein